MLLPRSERLLIPAAFVTALGNNIQLIAGALLVLRADGTMLSVGWLFIAVAAPQALLSPVFGRLADRFDRRRLWIGSDLASAVVALALPAWLWLGGSPGPGIYLANLGLAIVSALFFPASAALIRERIAVGELPRFNAKYEGATQAGMFLSATVGGLCVQTFGAIPLLIGNSGTFVFSALCVLAVRRSPLRVLGNGKSTALNPATVTDSTTAGGSGPSRRLVWMILLFAQSSVVVSVFNALLPKLVLGEYHRGAGTYGAVDAAGSLGFLLASWSYPRLAQRVGNLRLALLGFPLASALLALEPRFGVLGLLSLVFCGASVFGHARIASRTLLMSSVDAGAAGRVFGAANGGGLAGTIVAMLVVAEITDQTDCALGFAALALLSAAVVTACVAPLTRRGVGGSVVRTAQPPHVILDDGHVGEERVPVPGVLAANLGARAAREELATARGEVRGG